MALIYWVGLISLIGSGIGLIWLAWALKLRWWPSLVLRILVLFLVGLATNISIQFDRPTEFQPEILIIDRSDSISEEGQFNAQVFATVWKTLRPNRQVIAFGASSDYVLSTDWPEIGTGGSALGEALAAAETVLGGQPGRVILATDGLVDDPKIVEDWVDQFRTAGGEMDFILLGGVEYNSDVYMGQIKVASRVWSGMRFPVVLPVVAKRINAAVLQVFINGTLYKEGNVELEEGDSTLQLVLPAGSPGVMNVETRLVAEGEPFVGNNSAFTSIQVFAQPSILFVTKNESAVENLIRGLEEEDSEVSVIPPAMFPTSIKELETYQVIMVHDILAQDFNYEQLQAIKLHVLELGKGLVFLGGRNSYTLGGYQNTILEPLIPVRLAPPDRVQRVPITFLLVLDRSGSMAGDRNTDIAPIDLTREAAMRAIETLRSDDYLGVLTFSGTTNWDVDLRKVGEGLDLRTAQDKVSQIVAVGGTFMYQALEEAINQMVVTETTAYPHILLMTDGVSGDGSEDEFIRLVRYARDNEITISTIALGHESDPDALARIAQVGGGRFYQVYDPADLPQVMISESKAVQAENVQEGRTNLILGVENHPILSGFSLDELPLLFGYIATQSKSSAGAEDVLLSGNYGDPVLSIWQVGLGQVAAWMGDMGEQWNPDMKDWENQGKFWQQVARFTLPDPSIGEPDVNLRVDQTEMIVKLSLSAAEAGLTSSTPRWIQSTAGQAAKAYPMSQVSAGVYQVVLPRPEVGAYTGIVQFSERGEDIEILVPFAVNYPKEWRFEEAEIGAERITSWLNISNGAELSFELELENSLNLDYGKETSWFDFTLILLLISWPVEIAIRRWQMPWRRA